MVSVSPKNLQIVKTHGPPKLGFLSFYCLFCVPRPIFYFLCLISHVPSLQSVMTEAPCQFPLCSSSTLKQLSFIVSQYYYNGREKKGNILKVIKSKGLHSSQFCILLYCIEGRQQGDSKDTAWRLQRDRYGQRWLESYFKY